MSSAQIFHALTFFLPIICNILCLLGLSFQQNFYFELYTVYVFHFFNIGVFRPRFTACDVLLCRISYFWVVDEYICHCTHHWEGAKMAGD